MLNDQALNRLYEAMGVAGDSPMMVGRQRRIKAAVEAAYPDIRASVAEALAKERGSGHGTGCPRCDALLDDVDSSAEHTYGDGCALDRNVS